MKALILLLALTTSAFAQNDFLTTSEANKVNNYMYDICMDTYCGGDIMFFNNGVECQGSTCTIQYTAQGNSSFDRATSATTSGTTVVTSEFSNVFVNFGKIEITDDEDSRWENLDINFTCTLTDLPIDLTSYSKKEDLFYELVVFGCIRQVESIVYNW